MLVQMLPTELETTSLTPLEKTSLLATFEIAMNDDWSHNDVKIGRDS